MNFESWFQQQEPAISDKSAQAVIALSSEGATLPFIARYRKEQTNNLDEVGVQKVLDLKERWDQIIKRQSFIIEEITKQEKLTPELKSKIQSCFELTGLENLYLPYKKKRKTKAMVAKEQGLEPLANLIWSLGHEETTEATLFKKEEHAQKYVNPEKKLENVEQVLNGVIDILTEKLTETATLRDITLKALFSKGSLQTKKAAQAAEHSKFEMYFDYKESIQSLLKPESSHRYLAIKRGWLAKELSMTVVSTDDQNDFKESLLKDFEQEACPLNKESEAASILLDAARLSLFGYVMPSCENEVHRELKEKADQSSIGVFSDNVKKLLLSSPFGAKAVMGIDPGVRTGCKVAIVDATGEYKENTVIYFAIESKKLLATQIILAYCQKYSIQAIAIGNGTAGRETEAFVRQVIKEAKLNIPVVMVSEAGASVYSASEVAREEFPELDLTVRGAISIARRLQDPLAELVKIDPKSIGVGQYQHDVSQPLLKKGLEQVVEMCVNSVGVNLNTSSYHLLSHVSGIGPTLAKNIVTYRNQKGLFQDKKSLLQVPRFSEKVFEQSSGFLRVPQSTNPLDNTGVHPEQYETLEKLALTLGKSIADLVGPGVALVKQQNQLKEEIGEFTFKDMIFELEKPGRDSREEFVTFNFREDINAIEDLKVGMQCPGLVTNVTNFGAFVDIGVHQDGLVHISRLSDKFVKDPKDVVSPGDHVKVKVIEINKEKRQIALSMRLDEDAVRSSHSEKKSQGPRNSQQDRRKPKEKKTFSNNPFAQLGRLQH